MKKNLWIIFLTFLFGCSENNSNSEKISLGKKIYSNNCISCHDSGIAPDLSSHKLKLSEIINLIKKGGYGMPSFEDTLSKKEIEDVAYYIYKLN